MPTVDGNAAAQTLLGFGTCTPGYCLKYVWNAYAAHGATSDKTYPTALSAWEGSGGKQYDRNPPSGFPVYLGARAGSNAGDVVISLGGGMVAATDWPYNGVIGTCTIDQRLAQTGRPYLGWTDNMLGNPIIGGDDMPLNYDTDYDAFSRMLQRALVFDVRPNGYGADAKYGATLWEQLASIQGGILAIPADPEVEVDYDALAAALAAQGFTIAVVSPGATVPSTALRRGPA